MGSALLSLAVQALREKVSFETGILGRPSNPCLVLNSSRQQAQSCATTSPLALTGMPSLGVLTAKRATAREIKLTNTCQSTVSAALTQWLNSLAQGK